jgi:hypothetical protein
MSETKPRDLTVEELALLATPAARGNESAPLRTPPGTQIAIELLDPTGADTAVPASPMAGPMDSTDSVGASTMKSTAPTQSLPKAKPYGGDRSKRKE